MHVYTIQYSSGCQTLHRGLLYKIIQNIKNWKNIIKYLILQKFQHLLISIYKFYKIYPHLHTQKNKNH